ncbi:MAG: amidophosphoribosyltransferase [Oligosphaeraceae bacterium]
MSDSIKHECGVTLLRLRKPLSHYAEKYGTAAYGYAKLSLLLEKQHNRGQDGAGIACVGLDVPPGQPFYHLEKSCASMPLADLLEKISTRMEEAGPEPPPEELRPLGRPFCGEVYLGHVRYGTFGTRTLDACHPVVREEFHRDKTMLLAGNFNLTNTRSVFAQLTQQGYHPRGSQDCEVLLISLSRSMDAHPGELEAAIREAAAKWDGGFTLCGILGNGDSFAFRDATGIRPAFYHVDPEVVVVASERVAIQTAFNLPFQDVQELPPGHLLTVSAAGVVSLKPCLPPQLPRKCVFERIYFSRGNDAEIQQERRALGRAVAPQVLDAVDHDFDHTVFSYIPNTAQISFHGMLDALDDLREGHKLRFGMVAVKDAKFRTFISDAGKRDELFPHVYDVSYGLVRPEEDNLVVIDDSIVRGNTMRRAILPILDRLLPRRIVVVSSAPQIRYPDCYGIDMASFGELVAFQACMDLIHQRGMEELFQEAVRLAQEDLYRPDFRMKNRAMKLYEPFTDQEITQAICRRLCPENLKAELRVVFLSCQDLRRCIPEHTGDWYFTGDYPTPGGNRVVNQALVNYAKHLSTRAY